MMQFEELWIRVYSTGKSSSGRLKSANFLLQCMRFDVSVSVSVSLCVLRLSRSSYYSRMTTAYNRLETLRNQILASRFPDDRLIAYLATDLPSVVRSSRILKGEWNNRVGYFGSLKSDVTCQALLGEIHSQLQALHRS